MIDSKTDTVVLQRNERFSNTLLWAMQRDYFDSEGVEAWNGQVPFYVTSNPFVANAYANMSISLIRDWLAKHPESIEHPFYIMELGTGPGKLSFLVIKKIMELAEQMQMQNVKICYVLTDFTANNLRFWQQQPQLKPFVERGEVDFALYNMEQDNEIALVNANITLTKDNVVNPLIAYANYIFDTISHDAFTIYHGKLQESLLTLTTSKDNLVNDRPQDWEHVNIDFNGFDIDDDYYDDPDFNAVLNQYKQTVSDSNFLFPIGSLRAIRKLRQLSNDRLMIISTDKGYSNAEELENLNHPRLAFHGSFSMMVNFHAIQKYFEQVGGDAFLQSRRQGIKTCVFASGFKMADMPETNRAVNQDVENLSPADYFALHRRCSESLADYKIEHIAAHLAFSAWDPHIYKKVHQRICDQLDMAEPATIAQLTNNMHRLAENFYYLPDTYDIFFDIGVFFHNLNRFDDAITYYEKSANIFKPQYGLLYNLGLCYHNVGEKQQAIATFKRAYEQDPDAPEAREWVEYLESEDS